MNDYPYEQRYHRPRKSGRGWVSATLLLLGFLLGIVVTRALPTARVGAPQVTVTALVTATGPAATAVPMIPGAQADIPAIARSVGPAVVAVVNLGSDWRTGMEDTEQGSGSGVILSADGTIVTNYHVIQGASRLQVILNGGRTVDARVLGADQQSDLAVLKIEADGLAAVALGDSDAVEVGQTVIAIGSPLGTELAGTVTAGIVSAANRDLIMDGYKFTMIQTDAAINPGNSGGALVNARGQLIGINSVKTVSAGTDEYGNNIAAEGIGFAIPINTARPIIEQLIRDGVIRRPDVGLMAAREITAEEAQFYNVPQGVMIRRLRSGGPAARSGMRNGDIVTAIGDTPVTTISALQDAVQSHAIGDTVAVKVWRSGREQSFDVTLDDGGD